MNKAMSTRYIVLILIAFTVKAISQEIQKEFTKKHTTYQKFERSYMFQQGWIVTSQFDNRSFVDTQVHFPLMLKEMDHNNKGSVLACNINIYVVDTTVVFRTRDTSRYIYTYDNKGVLIGELNQEWKNNQWVNNYRNTRYYNSNGNVLSMQGERWTNGPSWIIEYRLVYTYNVNGNILSISNQQWTNDEWVIVSRITYLFDNSGNMLSLLRESSSSGQLENSTRESYTYDTKGNRLSLIHESWQNNLWINTYRNNYTYDTQGNQMSDLYEFWNNNIWVIDSRKTYNYDVKGNQLSILFELWSGSSWVNNSRKSYTYDANNKILSYLLEDWSFTRWLNAFFWKYSYNDQGKPASILQQNWSVDNSEWRNLGRKIYNYELNGNYLSVLSEGWVNNQWAPTDGEFIMHDLAGNIFSCNGYQINFTHKFIPTNVIKEENKLVSMFSLSQNYPNPFNPTTIIDYGIQKESRIKIIVTDILGRVIKTLVDENKTVGSYKVLFNAQGLSSGIYFYHLQTNEFSLSKKLILTK